MLKISVISIIFFIFSFQSIAQNGFAGESEMRPIRASLDELLNSWYIGKLTVDTNTSSLNKYGFKHNDIPLYADRTYIKRLNSLQRPIPLGYNTVIKRFIELYVKDKRDQVENMLGLSHYYFTLPWANSVSFFSKPFLMQAWLWLYLIFSMIAGQVIRQGLKYISWSNWWKNVKAKIKPSSR